MAKRANPYTEDFIPQSKIYIDLKQFNNNENRMKKVYEKTLQLLFKGAKNIPDNDVITTSDTNLLKRDKMKQLFIGKNGSLLHTGTMFENRSPAKQCSCSGAFESQCAYCEIVLCVACQHHCMKCDNIYCNHCILVGSEGADVCVSCYG